MFRLQPTMESKGNARKLPCGMFEEGANSPQTRGICRRARIKCGQVVFLEKHCPQAIAFHPAGVGWSPGLWIRSRQRWESRKAGRGTVFVGGNGERNFLRR